MLTGSRTGPGDLSRYRPGIFPTQTAITLARDLGEQQARFDAFHRNFNEASFILPLGEPDEVAGERLADALAAATGLAPSGALLRATIGFAKRQKAKVWGMDPV